MFKNRSSKNIVSILAMLLTIGLAFQNCAAPIDPSLLIESEDLPSNPEPASALSFNIVMQPLEIEEGQSIDLLVEHQSNSRSLVFEYTRNGQALGDKSVFARAENVQKEDVFRVVIFDNGIKVGERDIFVNIKSSTVDPVDPVTVSDDEVHIKRMAGTESIYFVEDKKQVRLQVQPDSSKMSINNVLGTTIFEWGVRAGTSGAYVKQVADGRSITVESSYLNAGTYVRVRGYNDLNGKWSDYVYMSVHSDSYRSSLTKVATKAPRKDLAQGQCEVPYFVSGVYTHYYSSQGHKHGQKVTALHCSLIRDEALPESIRGVGKVQPGDAFLDKGRLKAFGGAGNWFFGGANLTGSQNEFITGINPSQSGTSYVVYNSPQKRADEIIQISGEKSLVYQADKTHFAKCPVGTHVVGLEKEVSGSHKPLFHSRNYYYKYKRLICGKIRRLR